MLGSNGSYFAEILTQAGVITEDQAKAAEEAAEQRRIPLTTAVKELGFADSNRISQVLAEHFGLRSIDLATVDVEKDILSLIPHSVARRYKVVPLEKKDDTLVVAISDPLNLHSIDSLRMLLKMHIEPVIADADDIQKSIERHYGAEEEAVAKMLEEISSGDIQFIDDSGKAMTAEEQEQKAEAEEAPVIKLVSLLIMEAFRNRASDIHLEPLGRKFRIRYRIDGYCHEVEGPPRRLQGSVLSRVKIMAGMDIAEKRLPQDGRILIKVLGREIDLRVSALPGSHGESIVMRILDKEGLLLGLSELGFSSEDQKTYEKLIQLPHGVLLITGPTGSGKTTTLYACLNYINRPDRKIITVEDPVEYTLSGINQVHVNEDIGLTFAAALRSILRQAPNVIMIGEIRDLETAEIAINAALTGHLVFSTLHTNDAPSAIPRLIDIGVKPFLVASALQSVMAQRLVRKICPECAQPYDPPDYELQAMGMTRDDLKNTNLRKGTGCRSCSNTGYRGRIGIFELMTVNDDVQKLIYQCVPATEIRKVARQYGMKTLREDGMLKVLAGVSTFAEVMETTIKDVD
jgi:general secretion pathway protein E/type IV pilus assembly protein PilB